MIAADDTEIHPIKPLTTNGFRLPKHPDMEAIITTISLNKIAKMQQECRVSGSATRSRDQQPRHAVFPHFRISAKFAFAYTPLPFHFRTISGMVQIPLCAIKMRIAQNTYGIGTGLIL